MKVVTSALCDGGLKRDGNEDPCFITLGSYPVCNVMEGYAAEEHVIAFTAKLVSANDMCTIKLDDTGPLL